jgi:hypothetical protein
MTDLKELLRQRNAKLEELKVTEAAIVDHLQAVSAEVYVDKTNASWYSHVNEGAILIFVRETGGIRVYDDFCKVTDTGAWCYSPGEEGWGSVLTFFDLPLQCQSLEEFASPEEVQSLQLLLKDNTPFPKLGLAVKSNVE